MSNGQGSGQDSTPTVAPTAIPTFADNNYTGASQSAQEGTFSPVNILAGTLCAAIFLCLLFIGWRRLRGNLLPKRPVKLPPSGASPWSRERTDNPWTQVDPWTQVNNNQGFPPPDLAVTNGYGPFNSGIMPPAGPQQGFPGSQTGFPYPDYSGPPPSYGMNAPNEYPGPPTTVDFAPSSQIQGQDIGQQTGQSPW